jgi:hypothetical protein
MTSERKIAANRLNARKSTGPHTAAGKTRARRNALRHGLAARIVNDPTTSAEADHIVTAICAKGNADPATCQQAMIIAECDMTLRRVRAARVDIINQMSVPPAQTPDASECAPAQRLDVDLVLEKLLRLDRYERRALSRRRRAVRLVDGFTRP